MSKPKIIWISVYILLLVGSFFFVRSVLKDDQIDVSQKQPVEVVDTDEAKITINIYTNSKTITFSNIRFVGTDTVKSVLSYVRDKKDIPFETTYYTYGAEIDDVNNQRAPAGYKWRVFLDNKDVTNTIDDQKLDNYRVIDIKLVKI